MNLIVKVCVSHLYSHGVRFAMTTKSAVMEWTGMTSAKACRPFGKLSSVSFK